ncbi:hypothetical protein [Paraburkholderia solisilvae]|uniref:Uncharacterized protein n=1 Tax=Paraburkholderia solisilvae TaxID=624376 RepID=A0A6J5ESR7_9BURK|nr:hypothetical protein [Paraburkholderia solisilvae]CAB3769569.1 hypothetical protein LMG29739_05572 [Paraburkholderia solisilvae]
MGTHLHLWLTDDEDTLIRVPEPRHGEIAWNWNDYEGNLLFADAWRAA